MRSLPKTETLDREAETKLARASKLTGENGENAKRQIIENNLKLVIGIARDHQYLGLELEDLIAEGNIGLLRAVEKFDPEIGCRLSTYACWWIRESMKDAITKQARTIRIPKKTLSKIGKVKQILTELTQELGREPSLEEIASETEIAVHKLEKIMGWDTSTISADSRKSPGGHKIIETIIDDRCATPSEGSVQNSDGEWAEKLIATLKPAEREIIEARFGWRGEPQTLKEIGDKFGITRERVRQIEYKALKKLRRKEEEIQALQG